VSPAETDEPIEMPFVEHTAVGPRNHVLNGDPYQVGMSTFWEGHVPDHCNVPLDRLSALHLGVPAMRPLAK